MHHSVRIYTVLWIIMKTTLHTLWPPQISISPRNSHSLCCVCCVFAQAGCSNELSVNIRWSAQPHISIYYIERTVASTHVRAIRLSCVCNSIVLRVFMCLCVVCGVCRACKDWYASTREWLSEFRVSSQDLNFSRLAASDSEKVPFAFVCFRCVCFHLLFVCCSDSATAFVSVACKPFSKPARNAFHRSAWCTHRSVCVVVCVVCVLLCLFVNSFVCKQMISYKQ